MDAAPKPPAGVTAVDPSRRLGREFRDLTLTRTKPRFTVTFSLLRRPLDSTLRSTAMKVFLKLESMPPARKARKNQETTRHFSEHPCCHERPASSRGALVYEGWLNRVNVSNT
jgi:hypothetical protein